MRTLSEAEFIRIAAEAISRLWRFQRNERGSHDDMCTFDIGANIAREDADALVLALDVAEVREEWDSGCRKHAWEYHKNSKQVVSSFVPDEED